MVMTGEKVFKKKKKVIHLSDDNRVCITRQAFPATVSADVSEMVEQQHRKTMCKRKTIRCVL